MHLVQSCLNKAPDFWDKAHWVKVGPSDTNILMMQWYNIFRITIELSYLLISFFWAPPPRLISEDTLAWWCSNYHKFRYIWHFDKLIKVNTKNVKPLTSVEMWSNDLDPLFLHIVLYFSYNSHTISRSVSSFVMRLKLSDCCIKVHLSSLRDMICVLGSSCIEIVLICPEADPHHLIP